MHQRACACEGNYFFAAQHGPQKVLEYVRVAEIGDERLEEDKHELAVHVDRQRAIKVQILQRRLLAVLRLNMARSPI
eukprot:4028719-Pleurochrysis_carterae.AAC.1